MDPTHSPAALRILTLPFHLMLPFFPYTILYILLATTFYSLPVKAHNYIYISISNLRNRQYNIYKPILILPHSSHLFRTTLHHAQTTFYNNDFPYHMTYHLYIFPLHHTHLAHLITTLSMTTYTTTLTHTTHPPPHHTILTLTHTHYTNSLLTHYTTTNHHYTTHYTYFIYTHYTLLYITLCVLHIVFSHNYRHKIEKHLYLLTPITQLVLLQVYQSQCHLHQHLLLLYLIPPRRRQEHQFFLRSIPSLSNLVII
jgi:hypothetical protein